MENLILSEVSFVHKFVKGLHYFIGNDEWTMGIVVMDKNYDTARDEAMVALRSHLRDNHNICCGEWEICLEPLTKI